MVKYLIMTMCQLLDKMAVHMTQCQILDKMAVRMTQCQLLDKMAVGGVWTQYRIVLKVSK